MHKNTVIISRHASAVEFIARAMRGTIAPDGNSVVVGTDTIPVLASATADDVRGKTVFGNLPFHLACLANEIMVVEFAGTAPRGAEYDLAAMDAAGAKITSYSVTATL